MNALPRFILTGLLGFAALDPLRAATLAGGFGPATLVEGAQPIVGGCGKSMDSCGCQASMGTMAMESAPSGPSVRLGSGFLDASPLLLTVTNVGVSAYSINGVNNPILTLVRGETYTFNVTANGHPFFLKTVQSAGTGNAYNNGVTGNGTQSGTVTFTVPQDAPNTLFYDCSNHAAMAGRIDVIPEPSTFVLAAVGLSLGAFARRKRR